MRLKKSIALLVIWVLTVQTFCSPITLFAESENDFSEDYTIESSQQNEEIETTGTIEESDEYEINEEIQSFDDFTDDFSLDSEVNSSDDSDFVDGFGGDGSDVEIDGVDLEDTETEDLITVFTDDSETIINPLYIDVIDENDFPIETEDNSEEASGDNVVESVDDIPLLFSLEEDGEFAEEDVVGFTSEKLLADEGIDLSVYNESFDELALELRDLLERKETSVVLYWKTSVYDRTIASYYSDLVEIAMEHTGVPTQGDYIRWGWAKMSPQNSGMKKDGIYYITFNYTISYYITAEQDAELSEAIDEILESLNLDELDELGKIRAIYDYVCENVSYDRSSSKNDYLRYTAYAAVFNKTAVCQGYALLLYRLALQSGIDNRLMAGTAGTENHAWQIIYYDGVYYNMDSTWDSNYAHSESPYLYFMRCESHFAKHTRKDTMNTEAFHQQYPMAEECYHTHDGVATLEQKTAIEAKEATCSEEGHQAYYQCDRCGKLFSDSACTIEIEEPVWIEIMEHSWVTIPGIDATCISSGVTESVQCEVCGIYQIEPTEIPIDEHAHHLEYVESVEATYDSAGHREYYQCTHCEKFFADENGETELESIEEIPMLSVSTLKVSLKTAESVAYNKIRISWESFENAQMNAYKIYRHGPGEKWVGVTTISGDQLEYEDVLSADKGLETGITYTYTVRGVSAVNDMDGKQRITSYDAVGVSAAAKPDTVVLKTANATSYNSNTITWNAIDGALGYGIWRKTEGGKWQRIGTVKASVLFYRDATAYTDVKYYYTVRGYCKNANGNVWGSYDPVGLSATATLEKAELISAIRSGSINTIRWKKVTGADGYLVYRKLPNQKWTRIKNITNSATITYKDTASSKYIYTVKAYRKNPDGTIAYGSFESNGISVTSK